MLIIDGSGSMWGKLDGSQKILIVQSALDERLPLLADDFEVGLFAFGHRRAKNCEDVEELAPVAKLDREALAVRIGALSPRGKTPLALTLERAAAALPADRTDGRIVLIADGADNCRRDACATAAEIASGTPRSPHRRHRPRRRRQRHAARQLHRQEQRWRAADGANRCRTRIRARCPPGGTRGRGAQDRRRPAGGEEDCPGRAVVAVGHRSAGRRRSRR